MSIIFRTGYSNKKKCVASIFAFCSTVLLICIQEPVSAQDRWVNHGEIWEEVSIGTKLSSTISISLLFNNLYRNYLGNYDWFLEGSVKHNLKCWLAIEGMYRQEYYTEGEHWMVEKRPMFRVIGTANVGAIKVRNRQRFEFRIIDHASPTFRYRTDVKLGSSKTFTKWKLSPYLQEELFVYHGVLSRIRSYIGCDSSFGQFSPSLYCLIQSKNKDTFWQNEFISGIYLGCHF